MRSGGWVDLTNRRDTLTVRGLRIDVVGVDDPHLGYDRLDLVRGAASPDADLTLGVTHAPYQRVLDAYAADGADLIVAGHTHGGQVCVPGYGALVTNCDLDTARVKGLSRWWPGRRLDPVVRGAGGRRLARGVGRSGHRAHRSRTPGLPSRGDPPDARPPLRRSRPGHPSEGRRDGATAPDSELGGGLR